MVYNGTLYGKTVYLRSAREEDAKRTLFLRLDRDKTRFLHYVDNDLEKQKKWIRDHMNLDGDFFFVVCDMSTGEIIGTMGIYEICERRGHIGRLLMYGNAIQSFEAYMILFLFCFETLELNEVWGDTDINNKSAIRFSKRFGFEYESPVYDKELDRDVCYCTVGKDAFYKELPKIKKIIRQ